MTLVVQGIPEGKRRPRFSRSAYGVRTYKDSRDEKYEDLVRTAYMLARRENAPDWDYEDGAVAVDMVAVYPVPESWSKAKRVRAMTGLLLPAKKPDCDNILKQMDALNGVAWRDDAQVVRASIVKKYGAAPCLIIDIHSALTREG